MPICPDISFEEEEQQSTYTAQQWGTVEAMLDQISTLVRDVRTTL